MLTPSTSRPVLYFSFGHSRYVDELLLCLQLRAREQTDDLSDEGDLQSKPDAVQAGHDVSIQVVNDPFGPRPEFPYAAMFYECVLEGP